MDVQLVVDGRETDLEFLCNWLRDEPELQGSLRLRQDASAPGAMGGDLVVAIAARTAAMVSVFARSLFAYLPVGSG